MGRLKWYYDENCTFPTEAILLAKWWRRILNLILLIYDEKRYLSQFVSEMFDSLQ